MTPPTRLIMGPSVARALQVWRGPPHIISAIHRWRLPILRLCSRLCFLTIGHALIEIALLEIREAHPREAHVVDRARSLTDHVFGSGLVLLALVLSCHEMMWMIVPSGS